MPRLTVTESKVEVQIRQRDIAWETVVEACCRGPQRENLLVDLR